MGKKFMIILVFSAFFSFCNTEGNVKPAVGSKPALQKQSELRDTLPAVQTAGKQKKAPDINRNRNAIIGIWSLVGSENATFVIDKKNITYPDANSTFAYTLKGDSLFIDYKTFKEAFLIKLKKMDTLILKGAEEQVFYRFK